MKSSGFASYLWAGLAIVVFAWPLCAQESIREIMRDPAIDWRDPADRARAVERIKDVEDRGLQKARAIARQKGKPLREELPGGKVRELDGLDEDGELRYVETRNVNAAISTGANLLHTSPYSLTGSGLKVGVWDADSALVTHQEFNDGPTSRINNVNNQPTDDHATHVAGTIAAFGVQANAKGMAYQATIDSYDWTNDDSEMIAAGATAPGQFGTKVYLSNHSYGYSYGWSDSSGTWIWTGTGTDQNSYDADFGQYSSISGSVDSIAFNAPYYLIFWAAGNENNDGPNNGNSVVIGGSTVTYNSSIHPQNDGDYRNGFETIGDEGIAKNLITVGAVNDAVTGGQRDPSKATIASFSSTGPCDDGRIKPDLVGNGVGLTSPVSTGDASYGGKSGTSMATPNLTGSAALLVALYRDLFGTNAAMRSSTLKGLLIHTASDRGNPGPDYTHGWGLVDVKSAADLLRRQADFPALDSVIEDQLSTAQPAKTYTFAWDGVSPIRATLSWTDPAGSGQSAHDDRAPDLVNDLNLKLIAPDGTEYFPYVMPFVGTWTVASMSLPATTGVNHVDNVEQVFVQSPGQAGLWQVLVSHSGVLTNSRQDYGLIISGAGTAGVVDFNPSSYTIDENDGSATIAVERIGGSSGAISIDYATADGTAAAGMDYLPASGTLNWADGEGGVKTFSIGILNDGVSETYEETFSINLSNAIGTSISGTGAATVIIRDDETLMAMTAPNGGEQFAINTLQNITWISSLGGNVRIELLKNGINYTTIAASTPNDGFFAWTVPIFALTGSDYRIRITSLSGNESDESNGTFAIDNQQTNRNIYTANMDSNPGWTLQGAWAYGVPKGINGDPSSGKTGSNVIGYNLDGNYANNMGETHATTPAIDCSGHTNLQLSFQRWLGVESSTYDDASIQVSNDGTSWTTVWAHSGSDIKDASWQSLTYDISAVADQQATVYLRWTMGATDGSVTYCGWNIDDVVVSGLGSAVNPAGEVAFSSANFTVAEDVGLASITVDRIGGTAGPVSVDYATSNGTALSGSDYASISGTLLWADGDGASKTFSVPITNDSDHEEFIETIALTLTNTVAATISDANPVTLEIQDDDNNAPTVDAGEDQFVAWEDPIEVPGLYYGTVPGDIDLTTPNPATQILVDVSSETENSIAANTTEIYTGNIFDADGRISFTEHIDDKARIWIDGVLVLSNDSWSTRTSTANLNLAPGWHSIEIRISNGGGLSGPTFGIGIGYDPAGGTNWQTLVDPGDGSFLKVTPQSSGVEANLAGSASDMDADPLTVTWSLVSGPGLVLFADPSALDTTASFDAQGVYTLRLTADDGREQSSDDVTINVGVPSLALTIEQAAIPENSGTSHASVSRLFSVGDLVVNLASDDATEATVPASVTIPDGQASADFLITAQNDALVDGTQSVTITASVAGHLDGTGTLDVTDDPPLLLTVLAGQGGASVTGAGLKDPDGSPYPVTATASAGYDFANWTVTAGSPAFDNAYAASTFVSASADATVTANFALNTYQINYDGNGNEGGAPPSDQVKIHGQDLTLANHGSLSKTGYRFNGWNTADDGSGTAYPAGGIYAIDAPLTLFAQWVGSLVWDANGATAGQADGGGIWQSDGFWWNGSANRNWVDGSDVRFGHGGNGGDVTVGNVSAGSVLLDNFSGTYTLANGTLNQSAGFTLGAQAGQVTMGAGMTLAGDGGLAVNGGVLKTNGAALTYLGETHISGGGILLSFNNLPAGNVTLSHGAISDYDRSTTQFTGGLGNGPNQIQIYGDSGFGGGNGNSNFRIGAQNSVLGWGDTYFNPETLRLRTVVDHNGPSIYGQVTLQNRLDLNGGTRTIHVFSSGADAMSSWGRIDAGIQDTGGTGSLIKTGSGTLVLGGSTSTWGGDTTINEGILDFAATNIANVGGGSGRNISMANGTVLRFDVLSNAVISRIVETPAEITVMTGSTGNNLDFSSTGANLPGAFLANWDGSNGKTEYSGTLTPAGNTFRLGSPQARGVLGIVGSLGDGGSPHSLLINETGSGAVILTAANTLTGATSLRPGSRLILGNNLALQNSAVDADQGTLYLSTGSATDKVTGDSLADHPTFGGLIGSRDLATFIGNGSPGVNNTAALGHTSIHGFTLNPGIGQTASYSGVIGEFAAGTTLTKTGSGTQLLSGANTYTGATTINGGTLALGANQTLPAASSVIIGNASLDAGTHTHAVGTLVVSGAATIHLDRGGRLEFADSGAVEWTGGTLNLTGDFIAGSSIRFGTSGSGLTSAQLALVTVNGGGSFTLDAAGYLTPYSISTYEIWAAGTFAHPFIQTAPTANPDNDNLTNLQEFAFGTDPTVGISNSIAYLPGGDVVTPGLPLALNLGAGEGAEYLAVFGRRKDHQAASLTYTLQFSADLDTWVESTTAPTVLTGAESAGDIEAVSVPYPTLVPVEGGYEKPTFFRVGVSSN